MTKTLRQSIAHLYEAFAGYERVPSFLACGCCWSGGELQPDEHGFDYAGGTVRCDAPGGTKPLRELDAEDLWDVAAHMPQLGGTVEAFKHNLPRLFELGVNETFAGEMHTIASIVERLGSSHGRCHWKTWPSSERQAVQSYLEAFWQARLTQDEAEDNHDEASPLDIAMALVESVDDIAPYLDTWTTLLGDPAFGHVAHEHLTQFPTSSTHDEFSRNTDLTAVQRANFRTLVRWHQTVSGVAIDVSPIEQAVLADDADQVAALLSSGADPYQHDPIFKTPYWQLAFENGQHNVTKRFLQAGVALRIEGQPCFLHWVVTYHRSQVGHALDLGCDINWTEGGGKTALHHAVLCNYLDAVHTLVERGADITIRDHDGDTAIELAERLSRREICAYFDQRTESGFGPV